MSIELEYENHTKHLEDHEVLLADVITQTVAYAEPDLDPHTKLAVSFSIVDEKVIQELNKSLRHKDAVTDILSIGEFDLRGAVKEHEGEDLFLGELIVCYDFIKESAIIGNVHFLHELSFIVSHGILHLMGYEHGEEMFALQDSVSKNMIIKYAIYE